MQLSMQFFQVTAGIPVIINFYHEEQGAYESKMKNEKRQMTNNIFSSFFSFVNFVV